jgi:hypothetical protein
LPTISRTASIPARDARGRAWRVLATPTGLLSLRVLPASRHERRCALSHGGSILIATCLSSSLRLGSGGEAFRTPAALGRHVDGAQCSGRGQRGPSARRATGRRAIKAICESESSTARPQEGPLVQSAPRAKSVRHIGSPRDLPSRYG